MRITITVMAVIWRILQLQQLFILVGCAHSLNNGEQEQYIGAVQQVEQHEHHYHHHHRVLRRNKQGLPAIVVGRLGHVERRMGNNDDNSNDDEDFRTRLQSEVLKIIREKFGSLGHEDLKITGRIRKTKDGSFHVRLQELVNGLPVEGTGLSVHFSTNGTIYAMNGEHMDGSQAAVTASMDGETACGLAIVAANVSLADIVQKSTLELTNVMDFDGKARFAWKCQVEYHATNFIGQRSFRRDIIYGDAQDGSLCAIHPQVFGISSSSSTVGVAGTAAAVGTTTTGAGAGAAGAANVQTFTCIPFNAAAPDPFLKTCTLYSNSTKVIQTGADPLDSAHNYALATFRYYMDNHDLWSIDGNGMALTSYVLNQDFNFDNAFWSSDSMTYGDGDELFLPMSMDAGVVGHEFTHGVTEKSSGLIYYGESGALNEAWSDIFGVLIDRQEGARGHDIWILGNKISQSGDGLRDMSDPASKGHFDYYPTRYQGTEDSGGVHWNSGIANLAFKLLLTGGTHPRGKSSVLVRGLIEILDDDEDFAFKTAGDIFFCANYDCLSSGATFEDARFCTATICGSTGLREDNEIVHSIHTAWFAVGVGEDPSLTFAPSSRPTHGPTDRPTPFPSYHVPTDKPTASPTFEPSSGPTDVPTPTPTAVPTPTPTPPPSSWPTDEPSLSPSIAPSSRPSYIPTVGPSSGPSFQPSSSPSNFPTSSPSSSPTMVPSISPSSTPSAVPSFGPSSAPSRFPTSSPSHSPSSDPSQTPTSTPSAPPSPAPSHGPTASPSFFPSKVPSNSPTMAPSTSPSSTPSQAPSSTPSLEPTASPPSDVPSSEPSAITRSDAPSTGPSATSPSDAPSAMPSSSVVPSDLPSTVPSATPNAASSKSSSAAPSAMPISFPSDLPSLAPSKLPTVYPTISPTRTPTTMGFDELEPTMSPSSVGALLIGHIIGNPTIAKMSVPSQALNPSLVLDQAAVPSSIPFEKATATIPPIDPNIVSDLCPRGNSTCSDVKLTLGPISTPTPGITLVAPSTAPTLGSSRLTENEAEHEDAHEAANSDQPNGGGNVTQNKNGDDATQDANEKDAHQGNVTEEGSFSNGTQDVAHSNDSVPIDEDKHATSDKINVGGNITQETGDPMTGASHQTSKLDYSSNNDNEKIWILIVISVAMGVLVIVIAVLGFALYRTMKQRDENKEPTFKCIASAPLV